MTTEELKLQCLQLGVKAAEGVGGALEKAQEFYKWVTENSKPIEQTAKYTDTKIPGNWDEPSLYGGGYKGETKVSASEDPNNFKQTGDKGEDPGPSYQEAGWLGETNIWRPIETAPGDGTIILLTDYYYSERDSGIYRVYTGE